MSSAPVKRISMEDFRPQTLGELVGLDPIIVRLGRIAEGIKRGAIVPPTLLFHGPPGVGKTTAARAFGREVLGEHFENSFTELKAFDDRSARRLTEIILEYRAPPKRGAPFRILFFDEVEALTPDAQNALRPAVEGIGGTTLYLLACNEIDRLSKALQSRCLLLEFRPIEPEAMRALLWSAISRSPFELPAEIVESIVDRAGGIPREAIKLLIEEGGIRAAAPEEASG